LRCIHGDTSQALSISYSSNTIIYIDPPYSGTTGYGFTFNLASTVKELKEMRVLEVFVSECMPISKNAIRLNFGGPKGGISGNKIARHEEWLSACASA
jgi:site-specific DNA-adenine methylase